MRSQQVAEAIHRALALADVEACDRVLYDREPGDEFQCGFDIGATIIRSRCRPDNLLGTIIVGGQSHEVVAR